MTYAHIAFIEGDQGQGKNTTAVAKVVDPTFANITSVKLSDGRVVKATPTTPPQVGRATFWLPDRKPFVAKIPPKSCVIADSIKIYANFHLFGIRAWYVPLSLMIKFLNEGKIHDGYVLCDEHYIGADARMGMSTLVNTFTKQGFQIRKRHIELTMMAPMQRLVDWRSRAIVTEHIICAYNEDKREITLTVKKKGDRKYRTLRPFYAPQYWQYFDTDELVALPQGQIDKAEVGAR